MGGGHNHNMLFCFTAIYRALIHTLSIFLLHLLCSFLKSGTFFTLVVAAVVMVTTFSAPLLLT